MPPLTDSQPAAPTAGDAPADPDQWVDRYGDLLFCYALRFVDQREIAEDLVQDTFLAAWHGRDRFDGRSKFETWLVSILKHKIYDRLRRPIREHASLDEAAAESGVFFFDQHGSWRKKWGRWSTKPDDTVENLEFWEVLHKCVGELPKDLGQAFRLKLLSTESTAHICETLELTPGNLSVRLHRARLLLRNCLQLKWFGD